MDTKKLNTAMTILKVALVGIGVFASLWVLFTAPDPEVVKDEGMRAYRDGVEMGLAINYTAIVLIIALAAVILFFIYQLIFNTKKTVMSIIGIIVAFLVFLIFWMVGSSDTSASLNLSEKTAVDDATISVVSAGLYTAMLGVVAAVGVWLLSPLMGRLRK